MILARASIAAAVCLCQLFVATGGLVYHYGGRAEDLLLPPATSWYNLWVPGPSDPVLLYVQQPPPLSPLPLMVDQHSSQGRYTHSRALGQHPHPHRGGKHFGYSRHNGPDVWPLDYPQCGGSKQSPINLESNDMYRLVVPEQLQWHGYWTRPRNLTLVNNGHTIQVSGSWGSRDLSPWISGGPLDGEYKFSQLHFHWGSDDSIGSEHTVSNVSFPMEMHLVHYKKAYGSQEEATKYEDGLAVVSFLFQISDRANPALNAIIPFNDAVVGAELEVTLSRPFPLEMLDISFPSDYVTYLGSLTTPPCSEVVTWIVSSRPLTISHSQLSKFRHLSSADGEMENNFRPVQPTNGRPVFYVS
ncbi:carbonic anhydrase 2-like [Periplaneta americana]|uniref:carbonic anhydrase 2-like n=1 Tax=Periplaneta americana TaxID=6978 RepID=UPI0037E8C95A